VAYLSELCQRSVKLAGFVSLLLTSFVMLCVPHTLGGKCTSVSLPCHFCHIFSSFPRNFISCILYSFVGNLKES